MARAILIETPFASATQTAKILGVSKSRKKQLAEMLDSKGRFRVLTKKDKASDGTRWQVASKRGGKSRKVKMKRRLSSKGHASKQTRS